MILDLTMALFLLFLSYCLYIVVIIPYQEKRRHELNTLDTYIKTLEDTKQALVQKVSINHLK